jgi:EpsI family protein
MRSRVLLVLGFLLVAAVAAARADRIEAVPLRSSFARFPMQLDQWRGAPVPPLDPKVVAVLGADDYLMRTYSAPGGAIVGLYVGYWQSQRQGDTIHSPLNCLPGAGWEPLSQSVVQLPDPRSPGGAALPVNRVVIQKGLERQMVLYWYQSHGRIVASEYWGKLYLVADAMRFNRTDGSIVRVIAPISNHTPEAEATADATARDFAAALLPELDGFLPH